MTHDENKDPKIVDMDGNEKEIENLETFDEEKTENKKEETFEEAAESLEALLNKKEEECNSHLDKLMRTMAEYDNFRKRTTKEKSEMYEKGIIDSVSKFLDLSDNFTRALNQAKEDELTEKERSLYDGIVMLKKQFDHILKELDVEEIEAVGCDFNPELHNAAVHVEDEAQGESKVIEEFQKGYTYNNKVIRHSMVKVAN